VSHTFDGRIDVPTLARVEGEGALHVEVEDGELRDVRLEIYEPPRFFEGLLRGRRHTEPPDITARICGICPIAYQLSASRAIEDLCGVSVGSDIEDLRRLVYCGEWIESHVLHIYLLHAPDFLGYDSAIHMAEEHRGLVERALRLRKVGNAILDLVGGRAIHPVNLRIGGFHRAPSRSDLRALREELLWAVEAARETVEWVAGFDFPDLETDAVLVALTHDDRYPLEAGELATSDGLTLPVAAFDELAVEEQATHSTALRSRLRDGRPYLTGPLARFALNADRLSTISSDAAAAAGLDGPCREPFRSIIVRAVELLEACVEALRIVEGYSPPDPAHVDVPPVAGVGHGATEAPRGVLYHRYELDPDGIITAARIVPPTSQNQLSIEEDLGRFVMAHLDLAHEELQWGCEQVIRNHDPCISCATHFLRLTVERR
jgi:sulfhydrogenase subunit alpha